MYMYMCIYIYRHIFCASLNLEWKGWERPAGIGEDHFPKATQRHILTPLVQHLVETHT